MSARCKQEIFFWGKKILLYARNEKWSYLMVEYLSKKFSLDAKISHVMQETKKFHQGPDLKINFKSCFMQETKTFCQGPPT